MLTSWILLAASLLDLETQSEFLRATLAARAYAEELARMPSPSPLPDPAFALNKASVWLTTSLEDLTPEQLSTFRDIGFEGIEIGSLTRDEEGPFLALFPHAARRGISFITTLDLTPHASDVELAFQSVRDYPTLFRLIEIAPTDWSLLPPVSPGLMSTNIPFPILEDLHRRGYVTDVTRRFPSAIQTSWQATAPVPCIDGKVRRWIYESDQPNGMPALDWSSPTFAPERLGTGLLLDQIYRLGLGGFRFTGRGGIDSFSKLVRGSFAFSVFDSPLNLPEIDTITTDLIVDPFTTAPLLLLNAESLRTVYRLLLLNQIDLCRFLHRVPQAVGGDRLKPATPDEEITFDVLARSNRARAILPSPIPSDAVSSVQKLFTLFYAGQGGALSLSRDILPRNLYRTSDLRHLFDIRKEYGIAYAHIVDVPSPTNDALFLLLERLPKQTDRFLLMACNFSNEPIQEEIELPALMQTHVIDLIDGIEVPKSYPLSTVRLSLDAFEGKLYLFHPNP